MKLIVIKQDLRCYQAGGYNGINAKNAVFSSGRPIQNLYRIAEDERMKSLRCYLGFHDYVIILPGTKKVTYRGREYWPMGGLESQVCRRCGYIKKGVLLIPAGWDGEAIIVGE